MNRTQTLWLGWLCLLYNGFHVLSGIVTGEVGGFGGLVNPDRAPSLDYEAGWYVAIMALYAALSALGLSLTLKAGKTPDPSGRSEP